MVIEVPEDRRRLVEWCEWMAADLRYHIRCGPNEKVLMVVPEGELETFTRIEAYLIALNIDLDWRNHPDELIRRTIAETLRKVATWLPADQRELVEGPAFAVRGWVPAGMSCPVCQEGPCDADCPMRRISDGGPTIPAKPRGFLRERGGPLASPSGG